jgi:peptidoglycan hydrolase CwlO-like protein
MIKLDNTRKFYDEIKTMSFFKRLFSWGKIIALLTESYAEIKKVEEIADKNNELASDIKVKDEKISTLKEDVAKHEKKISALETDIKHFNQDIKSKESEVAKLEETKEQNSEQISDLKSKIKTLEDKRDSLIEESKELGKKISQFEKVKDEQQKKYDEMVAKLEKREDTLEKRRQELEDEQVEKEKQKFEDMKKTWKQHEDVIEQSIKQICHKYTIDYFDKEKVPFKGKPDNTVKIANEYIIFDAKSPYNDNLENFPTYIKNQAESLKKYISESEVKKDVFLVVPTNTIDKLETTFYDMSDYRVYVITTDSLEPIILSLRKIEDYEFAEKLSPEDREAICRVLGHFAHHTKRRLQIDTFLAEKSLELLKSCEYLPEDILDEVKNHEIKTIINVPLDKRSKKSELKKLTADKKKLTKELEIQHINTKVDSKKIESIELYSKED